MTYNRILVVVPIVLLVLTGTVFREAHAGVSAEERAALIVLYNSTDGDHWTDNSGWKDGELAGDGFAMPGTEGSWYGISLNTMGTSVEQIWLNANNLDGTISSALADLENLQVLYLQVNQLNGSIPEALGNLSNLRFLDLSANALTGGIPQELGSLTNLEYLRLGDNQLTGSIPPELGNLTSLQSLYLYNNLLTGGIPPELGSLTSLSKLYLGENPLTGNIPPEIGNLTNLQSLLLRGNKLMGSIPGSITNLVNLGSAGTDIGFNALYTDDSALRTFLNSKDSDWEDTQTIAPEDVSAGYLSDTSLQVSWTPIAFTTLSGGYRLLYSTSSGGPYALFDTTADKSLSQIDVTGLDSNTTYYFVIQTQTDPHPNNDNTVSSEYSQEAFATTSTSSLSGRVAISIAGYDDLAVKNGTISLQGTPYTTSTDSSGNFNFENVPSGAYTMTITSPGLVPISQEVNLFEDQGLGLGTVQMSVLTEADLIQAVQDAVESWDVNGNGKIELADILWWLQVLCGMRSQ